MIYILLLKFLFNYLVLLNVPAIDVIICGDPKVQLIPELLVFRKINSPSYFANFDFLQHKG